MIKLSSTNVIASDPHLGHALGAGHLEPNAVASLRQMNIRGDLAAAQIDHVSGCLTGVRLLAALVEPQLEIAAREPVALEGFESEALGLEEAQIVAEFGDLGNVAGPVADAAALEGHLKIRQSGVDVVLSRRLRAVAVVTRLRYACLQVHLNLEIDVIKALF